MRSSGSWTSVPPQADEPRVDSGSEIDVFSLISSNPDFSETSPLNVDANTSMALPLRDDQSSPEDLPPVRSAVGDWVQEQSQHDQPPNRATGLQRARTPPGAGQAEQARAKIDDHASLQECSQLEKKVYGIATLLRLRETQSAVPVMLRVKPEAIAENIFQYMGAATSRRLPIRSRGLSDISNVSTGIGEPQRHTVYPATKLDHILHPFRQPHAPPETSILQRHDGFARFLKQHASPPHHRVTAGGRIVPAGPSSPPPMLDFGSLNGLLRDRPETAKSVQKESCSSQSNPRTQNSQATSSLMLGDYLQSQGGNTSGISIQHAAQPASMQTAISLPFGYQSFMAPVLQTQSSVVPLAILPDGSTLVSYNGMSYRASWNGINTTMEPLQPLQQAVDQQYYPQAYSQGYLNSSYYSVVPYPSQASVPSTHLAGATNVAPTGTSRHDVPLQHQAHNHDELSLKTELTNLDKHLALYHYDILPAERASLIAKRRCLVEEIDRIRLSKEKPKHSIPIVAPAATKPSVTPTAQLIPGPNSLHEAVQNDRMAKGGTTNKHLSPAAPAFVPRKASNLPSTGFSSQQAKHPQFGLRAPSGGIDSALTSQSNGSSSIRTTHPDRKISSPKTRTVSHNEESSSSSVLDPSDPAMRVIDYEDIEYAARYLYNWTKDTKTYCTTVGEFQEAIRRVREQARLYGCAGGQSKDPAYDAEQDLWWAICDRDPIPVPSKVPDHVTNPRPWNWNDSAFNYRRQGANDSPGPGCEQARNSPRVVGWDPATTDKMKDIMDVSRSYFALKGQLPSVSFRDFAYDRDGKRRLIQSDTAVPSAYAPALQNAASHGHSSMVDSQREGTESSFNSSAPGIIDSSEHSIEQTNSALNTKSKTANKGKTPEAFSLPQGIPCSPECKPDQQPLGASNAPFSTQASKPHLSPGNGISNSQNVETRHAPFHAYIEDHPETPVVGGVGGILSTSKGAGTPQIKNTPFKVSMDILPTGNAFTGSPVPANLWDSTGFPGSSRKLTEEELNSIWYHTPLDEVTQKYLDDMKAYNPFKNKHADTNFHVDATRDHRQGLDSSEPVAESRSPWGPEEDTTPVTPGGRDFFGSPETHARTKEQAVAKTAKVNIPSASNFRATSSINRNDPFSTAHNTLHSREVNAVNVPSVESNDSHNFLRKMLKSPRYSSAQPMGILGQISSALADKVNGIKRTQATSTEQQAENKKITASYNRGNSTTASPTYDSISRPPTSSSLATVSPNLAVSKAQSSLASSTYQAHGYLPLFDGAGKAHTSSVYREQGIQPLPPQLGEFGYDGGRDSPPRKTMNAPENKQSSGPEFDTMGVTLADYDNKREDTNNAWHHGAVDDFFHDLHEQELQTIASHQRINTQSAAEHTQMRGGTPWKYHSRISLAASYSQRFF